VIEFSNQTFTSEDFSDRPQKLYENIRFRRCSFEGTGLICARPEKRSHIRGIEIIACEQRSCGMEGPIIENVLVEDFNTHGQVLFFLACVFKHVVFKGKIGQMVINNNAAHGMEDRIFGKKSALELFQKANAEYYAQVDWALDISQGEFSSLSIIGIQPKLIRRDPESQVIISRDKLLKGEWKKMKFKSDIVAIIDSFRKRDEADFILIAPKRSVRFNDLMEDFKILRKAGIISPD
jgi:hypothetical protein